jgi:hypothetical protein
MEEEIKPQRRRGRVKTVITYAKTQEALKRRGLSRMHCDVTPEIREKLRAVAKKHKFTLRELIQGIFNDYLLDKRSES